MEDEGEIIKANVINNNLGKYREKGELTMLLPEMQPVAPKKAQQ